MNGMLEILEDDCFYFDEVAAERPIKFIERYVTHYEGRFAGDPFVLNPIQKKILRDVYGWKWKDGEQKGLRRFNEVYFEAAVGAGKSPLLAALALEGLMADNEPGAEIYTFASKYSQARVIFDASKKFARANKDLARRLEVVQYEIRHPHSSSFYRVLSGKGPGAGAKPHMAFGDEAHEWPNAAAYDALRDRMSKRRQSAMWVATNSGESRASFCWQLREKAAKALEGKGELTLYPIIWAAPEDAKTEDPNAWKLANPLIGTTINESKIVQKCIEAVKSTEEEAKFRRLYLSIWPKTAGGRWLDLNFWDACTKNFNASDHEGEPLYVGLDLSQSDDLSAATFTWVTPDRFYTGVHFWMPRATAQYYYDKEGLSYPQWGEDGHIELIDEPTIGPAVRRRIAQHIINFKAKHKLKIVCYDRYKADDAIAALEAAGTACMPIAQGYSVSPGCMELERRLKERSITVADNPVLRFCAENATTKGDDRGNIWLVKPNAKEKYAGKRGAKIDGLTALCTSLVEARKQTFPKKKSLAGATVI